MPTGVPKTSADSKLSTPRMNDSKKALVVTGSMMSGFEQDAQEHDFHLLLKPVVPHKLRAMIAFKLGLR